MHYVDAQGKCPWLILTELMWVFTHIDIEDVRMGKLGGIGANSETTEITRDSLQS